MKENQSICHLFHDMKLVRLSIILLWTLVSESHQFTLQDSGSIVLHRYETSLYNKTYYLTTSLRAIWIDAFQFCRSSGMEFMTLESFAEHQSLVGALTAKTTEIKSYGITYILFGAFSPGGRTTKGWRWFATGEEIAALGWHSGQPDNYQNGEWCASFEYLNGVWGE